MNQLQWYIFMKNNKKETSNENETVNIPPPLNNDVEFDKPNVQVPVLSSDEEDYYTFDSQEMQLEPGPNDHDLQAALMVNYSGVMNVPANEVDV